MSLRWVLGSSIGWEVQCKQNCFFKSSSFSSFVTRDIRVVVDVKMFVIEIPYCFKHFLECSRRLVPSKALSETSINWTELFHMFFKHSFSLNYSLVGIYVKVEPRKMKRTMIFTSHKKGIRSYVTSLVISTWVRFFFLLVLLLILCPKTLNRVVFALKKVSDNVWMEICYCTTFCCIMPSVNIWTSNTISSEIYWRSVPPASFGLASAILHSDHIIQIDTYCTRTLISWPCFLSHRFASNGISNKRNTN